MTRTLIEIFPEPRALLALEPEDLGEVILEIAPFTAQNGMFNTAELVAQLFQPVGPAYPGWSSRDVTNAIAEAVSRLVSFGLVFEDPNQPARWYRLTRRAQSLKDRADVKGFRTARILPQDILPASLTEKVWPLFLRGDYDVAVFQAFKEVEVTVRKTANARGAGYADDLSGVTLMRKAFHPEGGALSNTEVVPAEREAEMHLFAGAMGHARNPVGHRDVNLTPEAAARLIVFASYLLSLVEARL